MAKILVFTGSRSDFDRLYWVCQAIQDSPGLNLALVAGNTHLSPEYGLTIRQVRESGLPLVEEVEMLLSSETRLGMAKSVGLGCIALAESLHRLRPDAALVLGDRFELLAFTAACTCLGVPLAHIGGGQSSEGAIDEQIRHMTTKAAHLHFVANEQFRDRLLAMGEEPWRVCATGSPSIDCLMRTAHLPVVDLERETGLDLSRPTALVTYHPETLAESDQENLTETVMSALEKLDLQMILTYPNSDPGSRAIIEGLESLAARRPDRRFLIPTLGQERYVSALRHVSVMIGNSSSGIIEASTFNLPVVNIGNRQRGRLAAENVLHCPTRRDDIVSAVNRALDLGRVPCGKPYGDGRSAGRIAQELQRLLTTRSTTELLQKRLYDPKDQTTEDGHV